MKEAFVSCDCRSPEHLLRFTFDTEEKQIYATIHLADWKTLRKRLWTAVKYVAGYKSKYGHYDEVLISRKEAKALRDNLNDFIETTAPPVITKQQAMSLLDKWEERTMKKLAENGKGQK